MKSGLDLRVLATALATVCLSACGGGGGGGGSRNGTPASNEPSVALESNTLTVSSTAWDEAVTRELAITLTNLPQDGPLYAGIDYSNTGVSFADIYATSRSAGVLRVIFKPATQLASGTHNDTISIAFCHDDQCARHLRNSPVTVTTQLTVGPGSSAVTLSSGPISAQGQITNPVLPRGTATLAISNPGPRAPFVSATPTRLSHSPSITTTASSVSIEYMFQSPNTLGEGVHAENAVVNVCYDASCAKHFAGSPITLPLTYTVSDDAIAEPNLEPVPYLSRTSLPHNVIDAEYSNQLEALVMVASYPSNALYLYDMAGNQPQQVALSRAPTSVSISPDGTKAAIGHDAKISYIDLSSIGQVGAPAPIVLDVGTDVFDIVLDGRGFAHAFPRRDQWVSVHSVSIATNIESLASVSMYAGTRARLHPSGDFIYMANNGLSPSDIAKLDVRTVPVLSLGDSPYHGQYGMCGNIWYSENGATIYTPCGNTFRATTTLGQDMTYTGRLVLSEATYGYLIRALSHSQEANEVALIEADNYQCNDLINEARGCYTHVALYDAASLGRKTLHSIPPIQVGTKAYAQHGQLIFHSTDGSRRYMISRLAKATNPAAEYYLTIMQ